VPSRFCSSTVGQPIFGDLAERLDDFGHLVGELATIAALLARPEIGRKRAAAFFDEPRQIVRELFDVDGADL
jgi:hypothetical protein